MKTLELEHFPLEGLALIEASAGTGKTYALANLYLRYLLEKRYTLEQILVVTFTEAATQELKDRIRKRIVELRRLFEGEVSEDDLLNKLFQQSTEPKADLIRLRLAEREMDRAEIYTIHSFCQRLLQDYAMALGQPLEQSLSEDLSELQLQAVQNFWRVQVAQQTDEVACYLLAQWRGPEGLLAHLSPLLSRSPAVIYPAMPKAETPVEEGTNGKGPSLPPLSVWAALFEQSQAWFSELKTRTNHHIAEVIQLVDASDIKFKARKLGWLEQIATWAQSSATSISLPATSSKPNLLAAFTPDALNADAKKISIEHEWLDFIEQHLTAQPASLDTRFLHLAYKHVEAGIAELKQQQKLQGFDDLIQDLARAFDPERSHLDQAGRARLVALLREQYQIALIDEFQDTDPAQYGIFKALFMGGPELVNSPEPDMSSLERVENSPEQDELLENDEQPPASMVLIGDPKQAIYAFRGGDIATYLQAKADIEAHPQGQLFTMDKNWRSSPAMVAAVNQLFMRVAQPFGHKAIPFMEVAAANAAPAHDWGSPLRLVQVASADPAKVDSKGKAKSKTKPQIELELAHYCGQELANLLATEPSIKSADIALLVRTGAQAELLKNVLADYGVRASFEGRSSIYQSPEASAIYALLRAVAEPDNSRLLRECLAHTWFGFSDAQVQHWFVDALQMEALLHQFKALQQRWFSKGVLSLIRSALAELGVYRAWRAQGLEGSALERRLSNINQLAELLQQQARTRPGVQALIRWLNERILTDEALSDDNRLRLESDEQLVQIVTIHRSKGLEYPVVFLPFIHSARQATEAWYYDEQRRRCIDLDKDENKLLRAEVERLEEDMRLLYVALTRARYRCYIGFSDYAGSARSPGLWQSAWGQLIDGKRGDHDWPSVRKALEDLAPALELECLDSVAVAAGAEVLAQASADTNPETKAETKVETRSTATYLAREFDRLIDNTWKVHSFTGLMNEQGTHSNYGAHASHGAYSSQNKSSAFELEVFSKPATKSQSLSIFDFPKGSRAGTFLHLLFEVLDFASAELLPELAMHHPSLEHWLEKQLKRVALVPEDQLQAWRDYLAGWVRKVLKAPLVAGGSGSQGSDLQGEELQESAPQGFSLSCLRRQDYLVEMEFHFSAASLSPADLNPILQQHHQAVFSDLEPAAPLQFERFEGHLKGAIDLVFRHQGRYFILDYKSNYLGDCEADYQQQALALAMLDHRYDLQYLLYTLALHRHLQARLGEAYDYDRDIGGVYYLFLRGLNLAYDLDLSVDSAADSSPEHDLFAPQDAPSGVFYARPSKAVIEALDAAFSTASEHSNGSGEQEVAHV